jgi:hypothetical protein
LTTVGGERKYGIAALASIKTVVAEMGVERFLDATTDLLSESQFLAKSKRFVSKIVATENMKFDFAALARRCIKENPEFDMREFLTAMTKLYPHQITDLDRVFAVFNDCGVIVSRVQLMDILCCLTGSVEVIGEVLKEWIGLVSAVGVGRFIETVDTFYNQDDGQIFSGRTLELQVEAFLQGVSSYSPGATFDLNAFLHAVVDVDSGFEFPRFLTLLGDVSGDIVASGVGDMIIQDLFKVCELLINIIEFWDLHFVRSVLHSVDYTTTG